MILSTSTATGSSSGSSPCSRESSMICCTSRASRSLSVCIRPANRCTASGSSAASITASESSLIAPTGVLSSWLTLATKSRRIDSTRRSRVRSSTRASTSWELSGATRAVTWRGGSPGRCMSSSVSRIWPSRRTCRTRSASSRSVISWPRTSPIAMAGAEAFSTVSLGVHDEGAAAQHREHGGHTRRQGRLGHLGGMHLSLADPEGEDGTTTEHCSEQREEKGLDESGSRHRSYAGFHRGFGLSALVLPALFTPGSRNDANTSPARSRFGVMRDAYTDQLDSIRDDLVMMARLVREAVVRGDGSPARGRRPARRAVISNDARIDALREKLEEHSFELLSLQNPVAGDLRMLVASLRMVSEFERMGDLAVHIAKIARLRVPDVAVPDQVVPMIARMAAVAEVMIGKVEHIIAELRRRRREGARGGRPGDGPACAATPSASCSARTGSTASSRPSTSPCSAATTSGSPTTPSRSPAAWSSWSPASTRSTPDGARRSDVQKVQIHSHERGLDDFCTSG